LDAAAAVDLAGDGAILGPDCDEAEAEAEVEGVAEGEPNAGSSAVKSARNGDSSASVSALQF
jgi:hypothetical protein